MCRKELFYYVTWGSNVKRDVHWCVTVDYQQIANDNIANQIHGFTIDYGKFILIIYIQCVEVSGTPIQPLIFYKVKLFRYFMLPEINNLNAHNPLPKTMFYLPFCKIQFLAMPGSRVSTPL